MTNKQDAFKCAYDDVPSQDNEGWVPERGSFKTGFYAAWDLQQEKIDALEIENSALRQIARERLAQADALANPKPFVSPPSYL